jgi:hypothetical protein
MLDAILDAVGKAKGKFRNTPLTAFDTLVGSQWSRELLLVGRAANGWGDAWTTDEAMSPEGRSRIAHKLTEAVSKDRQCSMTWVTDWWSTDAPYNTAGSAFWRVAKVVTEQLGFVPAGANWASQLAYTNLYRVSPHAGGNPSDALCRAQEQSCIQALGEDLHRLEPRRVLFLTGYGWAGPFVEGLGDWKPLDTRIEGIEAAGRLERAGRSIQVVIAPHPQGKQEQRLTQGIGQAWKALQPA